MRPTRERNCSLPGHLLVVTPLPQRQSLLCGALISNMGCPDVEFSVSALAMVGKLVTIDVSSGLGVWRVDPKEMSDDGFRGVHTRMFWRRCLLGIFRSFSDFMTIDFSFSLRTRSLGPCVPHRVYCYRDWYCLHVETTSDYGIGHDSRYNW